MSQSLPRLYVVIRDDLSPSQKAVQGGHALAAWLLMNPSTKWNNNTLIYLKAKNKKHLEYIKFKLSSLSYDFVEFKEPDLNNETTAICGQETNPVFNSLQIL